MVIICYILEMKERDDWLFAERNKKDVLTSLDCYVEKVGLKVVEKDYEKPWGGYVKFDFNEADKFAEKFFNDIKNELDFNLKMSPKFLLVAPGERLSWQYHFKRSEVWRVVEGVVGIKLNNTDEEPEEVIRYKEGDLIEIKRMVRHRLAGLGNWGLVAEIWIHNDKNDLSDEDDIVRLQDNYGR